MVEVAERHETLVAAFDAARRTPGFGAGPVGDARASAFGRFRDRGFPTTRDEEWKFTNVAPLAAIPFRPTSASDGTVSVTLAQVEPFLFDAIEHQSVVVNGRLSQALSGRATLPEGVVVRGLSQDLRRADSTVLSDRLAAIDLATTPFVDLNTAFVDDGLVIEVAAGVVVDAPIHVLFVTVSDGDAVMATPRLIVRVGERAQVSIVESYTGLGAAATFTNAVTQIAVGPGAIVEHVKVQREPASAFHMASSFIRIERSGTFTSQAITLGGRIARNDIVSTLAGEGAECTLNGLYAGDGDSLIDTHTTIDHAQAHCPSHEVYKGILSGRSRAVFNGKIIVRPDAQKTDAKQTNKALLLSDDAQVNTKPQLEIFADDVKCTHGAAIGQLDDEAIFYLRARGISEPDARNLLIHAFAGDVVDGVKVDAVRERIMQLLEEKLHLWKV